MPTPWCSGKVGNSKLLESTCVGMLVSELWTWVGRIAPESLLLRLRKHRARLNKAKKPNSRDLTNLPNAEIIVSQSPLHQCVDISPTIPYNLRTGQIFRNYRTWALCTSQKGLVCFWDEGGVYNGFSKMTHYFYKLILQIFPFLNVLWFLCVEHI